MRELLDSVLNRLCCRDTDLRSAILHGGQELTLASPRSGRLSFIRQSLGSCGCHVYVAKLKLSPGVGVGCNAFAIGTKEHDTAILINDRSRNWKPNPLLSVTCLHNLASCFESRLGVNPMEEA